MRVGPLAALVGLVLGGGHGVGAAEGRRPLREEALRADQLRVTLGALEETAPGRLRVESPKMRAVARKAGPDVAELAFTYLGPTREKAPLASGELRRQVGLKLRALDGCNLVYVMWRLEPKEALVVSVKLNPEAHTSEECGAEGYSNVRPSFSRPLPRLEPGRRHTLFARLEGQALEVQVDGAPVWRGRLGPEVLGLSGPVGVRTDNGRFELELRTP